jgi:ribosomal protein S18 acetylase RimI-like enzyme
MEVRSADVPDAKALVGLLRQLGYERDVEAVAEDLRARSGGDVIVATTDGDVVGLLSMTVHRQFHWGAPVASIESLVVDENARSAGIGSALLTEAVGRAREARCILVELHSNQSRSEARRFYEREGFTVTSNYFVRTLR